MRRLDLRTTNRALAVAVALLSLPALAQTDLGIAAKAASCNACHGPDGRSEAGIPPLAGRSADELYNALVGFKRGKGSASVMQHHAAGYSDQELRAIAVDFARQRPTREAK